LLGFAAEVALCQPGGGRGNIEFLPGGGRFSATHVPLGALIQKAYNFTSPQCHAKAEHPLSAAEMLRLLQNLLEDRFKLVLRRETKEIQASPVVLHILMTPLRSIPTTHGCGRHSYNALDLLIKDATMADLAWRLSSLTILEDHVVVDKTGLDGHYDIDLKFAGQSASAPPSDSDAPSIFTALREQLGLRLEAQKIPLEVLSVEHAERPAGN
jgi:uncharacterized protein (TIGR03435 family)